MSKKNKRDKEMNLAMEAAEEAAPAEETQQVDERIDFDGWWASRATRIPPQHHKEVIRADFRGRGLSTKETMEDFDKALNKYGVKLS